MIDLVLSLAFILCLPSPLDDLRRFPPYAYAKVNYEFAIRYTEHLDGVLAYQNDSFAVGNVLAIEQSKYLNALALNSPARALLIVTHTEAWHLRRCWYWLMMAQDISNGFETRRDYAQRLRLSLGEEAWAAGQMPPPVPLWRFRVHSWK